MEPTEDNFDESEEKEDQSKLALILIGAFCVFGILVAQIIKPYDKPVMSIEMPKQDSLKTKKAEMLDSVTTSTSRITY
jgi:hypothetical protein